VEVDKDEKKSGEGVRMRGGERACGGGDGKP